MLVPVKRGSDGDSTAFVGLSSFFGMNEQTWCIRGKNKTQDRRERHERWSSAVHISPRHNTHLLCKEGEAASVHGRSVGSLIE